MELLYYPRSPKDQNTLLTRKPKKIRPKINNQTQTYINTYKQLKKITKNRVVTLTSLKSF